MLIRPGALGDTLLTLPALALLRRERPAAHVTLVARADALPLARATGLADVVADFAAPAWSALFAATPPSGGSAADTIRGTTALAWLTDGDGTVARALAQLGARSVLIAPGRPAAAEPEHMALLLARALAPLGIGVPETARALAAAMPLLRADAADERAANAVWGRLGLGARPVVALHAGSGGAAKCWPARHYVALVTLIASGGAEPLLIEGPADAAATASVLRAASEQGIVVPRARNLTVGTLAALLRRCGAYVGNDSGVTHLAALAGVPALALFGPSDPRVWAPLGPRVRVLRSRTGAMEGLSVAPVWDTLREIGALAG
ncbi:MAG: glycosyltransferase family 9 protein [Ktedonobacterales bacterium]